MRRLLIVLGTTALCLASPQRTRAQSADSGTAKARETTVPPACCTVVRVDSAHAIVTARETATGFTFRFEVKNRRLLPGIKVGHLVWADFTKKTVTLGAAAAAPCCAILTRETP